MKDGWIVKKLTDVCHIQYGYAFDSSCFCDDKVYPQLVRIRDVVRGYSETYYKGNVSEEYYVEKGDYLIGMDGEFNIAPWKSERALLNQRVCKVSASDNNVIDRYVYYYLCTALKLIEAETPFVTVKHLSAKKLNSVIIPIPPLSEQSRIVEELDQLSNIIEKKRQQLSELDNLAQSIFYDMFGDPVTNEKGWEVKKIGDISTFHNGKAHEKNIVEFSEILLVNAKFISSNGEIKKYSDIQLFPLYKNDITMVMSDLPNGKTLAKCYLIEKNDTYTLNQRICAFRGYNQNPIFLKYVLNRNKYYLSFDDGNGQTNLRKSDVVNCPIIIPPLSLQQLFAQKIEAIEKEKELIKQSIAETEELFNSRMDYYFG